MKAGEAGSVGDGMLLAETDYTIHLFWSAGAWPLNPERGVGPQ